MGAPIAVAVAPAMAPHAGAVGNTEGHNGVGRGSADKSATPSRDKTLDADSDDKFEEVSSCEIRSFPKDTAQKKRKFKVGPHWNILAFFEALGMKTGKQSKSEPWWWMRMEGEGDWRSGSFHTIATYKSWIEVIESNARVLVSDDNVLPVAE